MTDAPAEAPSTNEPISLRRFLSDTVIYGFVDVSDKAVGFVLMLYITHILTEEDYGKLGLYGTTCTILSLITGLGMQTAFFRFYTESPMADTRRAILNTAFSIATLHTLVWYAVLAVWAPSLQVWLFEQQGVWLIGLIACSSYLDLVDSLSVCRLQADGRAWTYLAVRLTSVTTIRGAGFILILCGWGWLGWVYGQLFGQCLSVILLAWLALRGLRPHLRPSIARDLLPYGASLVPIAVSHWLMRGCDKYMLNGLLEDGQRQVGFFSVGERISSIMDLVNMAFILGWRRFAFRNIHLEDGPRLLGRGMTIFAVLAGYAALGLSLLGDDLTHWAIARRFETGIEVIPALTCAGLFWGLGEMAGIGLHKMKRTPLLAGVNLVAALGNIALNFLLIPKWGILGAASATCLCQFLKAVAIWRLAQHAFPLPFEWRRLLTASAIFLTVFLLGQLFPPLGWVASTIGQSVLVLATPCIFLAIGFLTADERQRLAETVAALQQRIRSRR